jgi:hypothetical protein
VGPIAAATGSLVHLAARIWTTGQTSGTLEDRCPDRDFAMERLTASARPLRIRPGNYPDPTQEPV